MNWRIALGGVLIAALAASILFRTVKKVPIVADTTVAQWEELLPKLAEDFEQATKGLPKKTAIIGHFTVHNYKVAFAGTFETYTITATPEAVIDTDSLVYDSITGKVTHSHVTDR